MYLFIDTEKVFLQYNFFVCVARKYKKNLYRLMVFKWIESSVVLERLGSFKSDHNFVCISFLLI